MKDERDKLTSLCDSIKNSVEQYRPNEMEIAREYVKGYISDDRNKLLELKAQIKYHDEEREKSYKKYPLVLSILTLIVSFFGNLAAINEKYVFVYISYVIYILLVIAIIIFIILRYSKLTSARNKYIRYIEVVIEEIDSDK